RDPDRRRRRRRERRPRAYGPVPRLPRAVRRPVRGRLLGLVRVCRVRVNAPGATIGSVGRLSRIPLWTLALASVVLVTTALVFVFFVAPTTALEDGSPDFPQRIFYFHVSIAFAA